jgi:hypothetical protein
VVVVRMVVRMVVVRRGVVRGLSIVAVIVVLLVVALVVVVVAAAGRCVCKWMLLGRGCGSVVQIGMLGWPVEIVEVLRSRSVKV